MSDLRNRLAYDAAAARYDNALPPDEPSQPDCPECGHTMTGEGDENEWYFECEECGFVVSGDVYGD